MKFNITYDPATVNATTLGSMANLVAFENQINAAAGLFSSTFLDPVTVNITVEYGNLVAFGNPLARTLQGYIPFSAATVQDALKKDETSLDDQKTSKAFAPTGTIWLPTAQAKALGLMPDGPQTDGTITFNNAPNLFDFTHSSSMSPTSFDLYGVAAHEISEVMGRVLNPQTPAGMVLPTVVSQFNTGGNFTIGSESLLKFNAAPTGDRGDWDSSVPASDAFRAFMSPGVVDQVSATDLRALDVVGWDHKAKDLVLAIDTTGSMGAYIANVQAKADQIVNAAFGTDTAPIDTRIGIVGFKDAAGPNGPGENTDLLNFTEQDTYDARKAAAINAINSISVGGGGDIPEGDNSALLYALQGNLGDWRGAAQQHDIVLFTDAPIKDYALTDQVAAAAKSLHATVTSGAVTSSTGVMSGNFSFTVPSSADATTSDLPDSTEVGSLLPSTTPPTITFSARIFVIQVGSDPTATSTLQNLAIAAGGYYLSGDATNLADVITGVIENPPSGDIAVFDTTTQQTVPAIGDPYTGPVAGIQNQFVYPGSDNVNISVSDDNWFAHGGSGDDAIAAHGGYNVLDGGTGSNFLTGGSGTDTFFVDDRGPPADIWSTVTGFHAGDDATVFGIVPNADNSNIQWFDNQGAPGYTGLTLHVPTPGQPTASLSLPGYSMSDLSNGRLAVQFGNETDGTPFMHIIANG